MIDNYLLCSFLKDQALDKLYQPECKPDLTHQLFRGLIFSYAHRSSNKDTCKIRSCMHINAGYMKDFKSFVYNIYTFMHINAYIYIYICITTHFTDMCIPHFFLASERRSTVDVRRRPGYKIWRLFKFEFSEVNINQYK